MNQLRRKKLLAGILVACVCSAADAADKVPTLSDVLKASGIDVSGYIDVTYSNFDTDSVPAFTSGNITEKNSFNINALDVAVSSLPASGAGGLVEVMAGNDVGFHHSRGWQTNDVDLLQIYTQYAFSGLTLMAGKFLTLAGAEVPQNTTNPNISHSLLYTNAIATTHTGLRGTFAPSDALKFTVGLNNGWDIMKESFTGGPVSNCTAAGSCADGKTIELGVAATPSKQIGLTAALYSGEEFSSLSNQIGNRQLLDVVGTFNVTDALAFVLNVDAADQEKASATGGKAKWNGVAAYANYSFTDKFRGSLRVESFDDKQCFRTFCGTGSQKLQETTVTLGYMIAKGFEVRGEVRMDDSDKQVFTKSGSATDKQTFLGVEALYKF